MNYVEESFCEDCGELVSGCNCGNHNDNEQYEDKEWRFEYAFESITDKKSQFKNNMPIK